MSLPSHLKKEVVDFIKRLKSEQVKSSTRRKAGLAKGLIKMNEDFDDPLADFEDYK